jgi:hypothetical protein
MREGAGKFFRPGMVTGAERSLKRALWRAVLPPPELTLCGNFYCCASGYKLIQVTECVGDQP